MTLTKIGEEMVLKKKKRIPTKILSNSCEVLLPPLTSSLIFFPQILPGVSSQM